MWGERRIIDVAVSYPATTSATHCVTPFYSFATSFQSFQSRRRWRRRKTEADASDKNGDGNTHRGL